jgi:hypothetical protein
MQITPWRRLLPEQLVKKCPFFYATRKFITVCTWTRHWSLCWARSIQSTLTHPVSLRSTLMYPIYAEVFQMDSSFHVLWLKFSTHFSAIPFMLHFPPISFPYFRVILKWSFTIDFPFDSIWNWERGIRWTKTTFTTLKCSKQPCDLYARGTWVRVSAVLTDFLCFSCSCRRLPGWCVERSYELVFSHSSQLVICHLFRLMEHKLCSSYSFVK